MEKAAKAEKEVIRSFARPIPQPHPQQKEKEKEKEREADVLMSTMEKEKERDPALLKLQFPKYPKIL